MMNKKLVFVYGTLRAFPLGDTIQLNDHIRGMVVDLGAYPALVTMDTKLIVEGDVVKVDEATLKDLDKYEGVGQGLYRRETTTTIGGHEVIVYMFNRIVSSWKYVDGSIPQVEYQEGGK